MPFALLTQPTGPIAVSPAALLGLLGAGIVGGAIAPALSYRLIGRLGAPRAASSVYLTPAFAMILSVGLLGERISLGTVVGLVAIMGSVVLVMDP